MVTLERMLQRVTGVSASYRLRINVPLTAPNNTTFIARTVAWNDAATIRLMSTEGMRATVVVEPYVTSRGHGDPFLKTRPA